MDRPSRSARDNGRLDRPPHGDLAVEALLGRSVVDVVHGRFGEYLATATVLVTGAAGSVGVELCQRLTRMGVRELVLVDHAEGPLTALVRAVQNDMGLARAMPVLADVKSRTRMIAVFERHRPDVVFHAAAYKSVPLLEACPVEGATTNVLGTKYVVEGARRVGVRRFVLFSTDKAVCPTSVLGQTKAAAEWIVAAAGNAEAVDGRYASIRLGNVLDSTGSIVPIFRQQVARGGPVTVTHPQVTRYLMTSGEAAGLAIVAGGLADSGGVFWFDSGPPVRIVDLVQRIASVASRDVDIDFVGLRNGERLHEQLFSSDEEIAATSCARVWRSTAHQVDPEWMKTWLAVLTRRAARASANGVRSSLAEIHSMREQGVPPDTPVATR